jgi:hypothetical protein
MQPAAAGGQQAQPWVRAVAVRSSWRWRCGRGCPVGSTERWLRRLINPWSTRATAWCCESALRRRLLRQRAQRVQGRQQQRPLVGPPMVGNALRRRLAGSLGTRAGSRTARHAPWYGRRVPSEAGWVFSPGGWTPPPGVLPAWSWVPPAGAKPRPDVMPWWVRAWYELPLLDRYAHAWMWAYGGWEVRPPPSSVPPGEHAGVREPRDPALPGRRSGAALAIPQAEQEPH